MSVKGTIGFCSKRANFISKAIRWFTKSKWSHTYAIYQVAPEVLVVEAGTFTVQLIPFTKYDSKKYLNAFFVPSGFTDEEVERGLAKVRGKIEAHYGWLQLIGFIPVIFVKRLCGMQISNPSKGGIICSELILQYLRGLEPGSKWDSMDRNTISPEDLFVELSTHPKFTLQT